MFGTVAPWWLISEATYVLAEVNTFELAIEAGKPVLIESMQETVDAVLTPVITRSTIKRGSSRVLKLGDKEIKYSPNFKLVMHKAVKSSLST